MASKALAQKSQQTHLLTNYPIPSTQASYSILTSRNFAQNGTPLFFFDQYPEAQQGLGLMVGQANFFHMAEPASAETSQVTSVQSPLYGSAPQLFEHSILDTPDPGRGNPVNNAFGSSPPAW